MPARRRWWLATLLSIPAVGLGQVYNGQARKGLLACGAFFLLVVLALWLVTTPTPVALIFLAVGALLALRVWLFLDAALTARRLGQVYELKRYNRWYLYLGAAVLYLLLSFALTSMLRVRVARSFSIPSSSMEPTIQPGDHLYVDMRSFRRRPPARGELAVFRSPLDPETLVLMRVVAVPGDRIEVRSKKLFLDGRLAAERYVVHRDARTYTSSSSESEMGRRRDQVGPLDVPDGTFFVMGDNRDASLDSRFYGAVPRDSILGGPRMIVYWSRREEGPVRWERIGRVLR